MSVFYFFLALSLWFFFYKRNKDLLQPCGVFLFMWFFTSSIANLDLYNDSWSVTLHVVVTLSGFSFFIGSLLFSSNKKFVIRDSIHISPKFHLITHFLFLFSIISFLIEWKYNGFKVSLLSTDFDKKSWEVLPLLHYGVLLLPYVAILYIYDLFNLCRFRKLKIMIVVLCISISFFILMSRGDLMIYLFAYIFLYSRYRKLKIYQLVLSVIFLILILVGVMVLRLDQESIVFSAMSNPYVSVVYTYISTCFSNLDKLIELKPQYDLYGAKSFSFLWTLIGEKDAIVSYDPYRGREPFEVFNASTYLYAFYYDFKILGTIVFPFIMGMIYSKLYALARFKYWDVLLASMQKAIITAFFGNYLFGELVLLFPFLIILGLILSLKSKSIIIKKQNVDTQDSISRTTTS